MKSYFVIGSSMCFPEMNVTKHFEKYTDARAWLEMRVEELVRQFRARVKKKEDGRVVDVILRGHKITLQISKYIHEAPVSMYVR